MWYSIKNILPLDWEAPFPRPDRDEAPVCGGSDWVQTSEKYGVCSHLPATVYCHPHASWERGNHWWAIGTTGE